MDALKVYIYACISLCPIIIRAMFCHSGTVTLSPSGVAPVCSGGQLELTCTTTDYVLQWRFRVFRENERIAIEITRTITPTGSVMLNVTVNSTVFNFWRISAHNSVPVMSRSVISPVSNGLNGTVMNCVDVGAGEVASTTIIVGESGASQGIIIVLFFTERNNARLV